jgi:hypothetical protein
LGYAVMGLAFAPAMMPSTNDISGVTKDKKSIRTTFAGRSYPPCDGQHVPTNALWDDAHPHAVLS